jgi:hypothetical protein
MTASVAKSPTTITVHVPMTFAIHGGRKTIISEFAQGPRQHPQKPHEHVKAAHQLGYASLQPRKHNALIKALARAHRWRHMIENGQYASITELAEAMKVNESYACRLLRLTLLAPAIIADILDGRHGADLMLKCLMKPISVRWDEQVGELRSAPSNGR